MTPDTDSIARRSDLRTAGSAGRMLSQAFGEEVLEPDESLTVEGTWDDPDGGEYTAVASLAATEAGGETEARVELSV